MIESCLAEMADQNMRETETRRLLLSVLHAAKEPLSPPRLVELCHQAGRKANKTTIYRDLASMEKVGIVRKVIVSDRKQFFELTERGHHHHFICTYCEEVQDIELDEMPLMRKAEKLSQELHFTIASHAVEFYGQCMRCSTHN